MQDKIMNKLLKNSYGKLPTFR